MDKLTDIETTINRNLESINIDINTLSKRQIEHLIKIEKIISEQLQKQSLAIEELNKLGFSINSISDSSGIARQTFYNNRILKLYIEHCISLFNQSNPYMKIKELNDYNSEILDENTKMKFRDLNIELLKHDMENLKIALSQKDREISQLSHKNNQLTKKINDLRQELLNKKKESEISDIVNIDFNK